MRAAAAALVLAVVTSAWATPRSDLAREFVAYLKANGLSVTVTKQTEDDLELSIALDGHDAKPAIALENIERYVSEAVAGGASPAEAKQQLFAKYLTTIRGFNHPKLTLAHDGARVMPRLIPVGYVPAAQVARAGKLGDTGLEIAYVLDAEGSVRYLSPADVRDLGLAPDALRALAMQNLGRTMPLAEVRKLIATAGVNLVKKLDSFDAARLLLVQAALKPGESVAAVVPDRDTLVVVPAPPDGDWTKLRAMAKIPPADAAHPLLTRPLLVTRDKIELR